MSSSYGRQGSAAWGGSRSGSASDNPFATPSRPSDFPALGTAGPSKSAQRKKSNYTLPGTRFDAYPPRHDTLARIYLEQEGLYYAPYDDMQHQTEEEEAAALAAHAAEMTPQQRSGMSSVVIYDADGQRVNGGPDIYNGRRNGKSKSRRKAGDKEASQPSSGIATPQSVEPDERREERRTVPKEELPEAFTAPRVDFLIQEHCRHRRLGAIERRLGAANGDAGSVLESEIAKALSSVDGFLAAFSRDGDAI